MQRNRCPGHAHSAFLSNRIPDLLLDGHPLWLSVIVSYLLIAAAAAAAAKSLQLCPTPCDPIDGSPPGSPIPGILQARTLELVAISFFNAWKWKVKVKSLSRVRLFATPWTAAHQASPSMGFSRQEYWSGVPLPSSSCIASLVQMSTLSHRLNVAESPCAVLNTSHPR